MVGKIAIVVMGTDNKGIAKSMNITKTELSSPLYAVVDLGSNSFHMLITRQLANSVQVVDKVKRKVRLAAGLDKNNILSHQAIENGLTCLRLFAERLQDIPPENIRIVATATLRLAKNRDSFFHQAEEILGRKITLLSGLDEAKQIYLGVAHTSCGSDKRLVIDIGGASTEIIAGDGFSINKAVSLDIGCVTFNQQFFSKNKLTDDNFTHAITAAERQISTISEEFIQLGWQCAFSGSGTMQALTEILRHNHLPASVSLEFLYEIRTSLINAKTIEQINIDGLTIERTPVFASGLSILIALFQQLAIKELKLSNGALREGLLYEMLADKSSCDIRKNTISALITRFSIDNAQSQRVKAQAQYLFSQLAVTWSLTKNNAWQLLEASCDLHEIGLIIGYKNQRQHSGYILSNTDLAGFNHSERILLSTFVQQHQGEIDLSALQKQGEVCQLLAIKLLVILRLSVLLCHRRQNDACPDYNVVATESNLTVKLSNAWLSANPLTAANLYQEQQQLTAINFDLVIQS